MFKTLFTLVGNFCFNLYNTMLQGIERFWPSADSNSQDNKSVFYREDIFSDNDIPFDVDEAYLPDEKLRMLIYTFSI